MTRSVFRKVCACVAIAAAIPLLTAAQTPPEKFLGFKVGADRQLADYAQITAYFQKLDQESPRLQLFTIGESTLKKPMIMAAITSEANMPRLDAFRAIARRLRDDRSLGAEEARRLAKEGKAVLLITCNIHASEIAASQMSMELAYKLVTGDTPFDAARVLEDVIVLLVPTHQPRRRADGRRLVQEEPGHAVRGRPDALALSPLRRPRQQPRLVHVQPAGDEGRQPGSLPRTGCPRSTSTSTRWARPRPGCSCRRSWTRPSPRSSPSSGGASASAGRTWPTTSRRTGSRASSMAGASRAGGSAPATTPPGSTTSSAC